MAGSSFAFERWRYAYIEGLGRNATLTFVDVNRTGEYRLQAPEAREETAPAAEVEAPTESGTPDPDAPASAGGAAPASADGGAPPAGETDASAFQIGAGVKAPSVLVRISPPYPPEAREAAVEGTVILETVIRRDGSAEVLRVIRSLGYGLDEAAVDAIRQWRFRPGTRNGEPVDVVLGVEVNFHLR